LGLLPFDFAFLKIVAAQLILILVFYRLPDLSNDYLNFVFKVGGVFSTQLFVVYKFKWLKPLNAFLDHKLFRKGV
jgi:hypothetical protein